MTSGQATQACQHSPVGSAAPSTADSTTDSLSAFLTPAELPNWTTSAPSRQPLTGSPRALDYRSLDDDLVAAGGRALGACLPSVGRTASRLVNPVHDHGRQHPEHLRGRAVDPPCPPACWKNWWQVSIFTIPQASVRESRQRPACSIRLPINGGAVAAVAQRAAERLVRRRWKCRSIWRRIEWAGTINCSSGAAELGGGDTVQSGRLPPRWKRSAASTLLPRWGLAHLSNRCPARRRCRAWPAASDRRHRLDSRRAVGQATAVPGAAGGRRDRHHCHHHRDTAECGIRRAAMVFDFAAQPPEVISAQDPAPGPIRVAAGGRGGLGGWSLQRVAGQRPANFQLW